MELRIDTNVPAPDASRVLEHSGEMVSQSLERLSRGLRLDSTADAAAGLGIAEDIGAHVRGEETSPNDVRDGARFDHAGEGALNETTHTLRHIRSLARHAGDGMPQPRHRYSRNGQVPPPLVRDGSTVPAILSVAPLSHPSGADRSRLEFTIDTLVIQEENSSASENAIRDASIAAETISFTRNRILADERVSVLAQANVMPGTAITLLG